VATLRSFMTGSDRNLYSATVLFTPYEPTQNTHWQTRSNEDLTRSLCNSYLLPRAT